MIMKMNTWLRGPVHKPIISHGIITGQIDVSFVHPASADVGGQLVATSSWDGSNIMAAAGYFPLVQHAARGRPCNMRRVAVIG